MSDAAGRLTLRDLSLPTRLVVATFLVAAGLGYFSALVQLHFQHATPGELLPGSHDIGQTYAGGGKPVSRVERLLEANQGPMNGAGTMRPAFTDKSEGWDQVTRGLAPDQMSQLLNRREGERLALLAWVRDGAPRDPYERDEFFLSGLDGQDISAEFVVPAERTGEPRRVRIRSLINRRCASCHSENGRYELARGMPMDGYDRLKPFCQVQPARGMSLPKLAQTTHAHLLAFAMLFGLTGLAFSFTSYSIAVRAILGPFPLVVQLVEIACWWLARLDAAFAQAVLITGVLVGLGLAAQIAGGLWDLFGRAGRIVLVTAALLCVAGAVAVKGWVIDPYLERERIEIRTP